MGNLSDDDLLRDPNGETSFRWQNDKETRGVSTNHEPPPWNVGEQLQDFVLESLLGVGSSGYVYRVREVATGRRAALKLLREGPPDDLLRNKLGFRRMMTLDHPHLLRVDRIHQLGSYIALSMEEVDGKTFRSARVDLCQLPREDAYLQLMKLIREYAAGLAAMHANGLVHRDVKPDNLMVDRDGCGRVIDYGLVDAYELDQASIETRGFLLGTPHYMAPEVIWSQRYLPAGDIFSLGIVLLDTLRMLERSQVNEKSDLNRSEQNRSDDAERIVEAIEDLPDSVPAILRETCREMLDRFPSERPTAMTLARLGLPLSMQIPISFEPPMVGRDDERRECLAWVDEVFAGKTGRLHLTGDSGVGKSRLIQEVIRYIESKHWGQVFLARCRLREDQPLQAFDQLCDAIAHRYLKGDRESLRMDPVSVTILQSVFPVLRNMLESTMKLSLVTPRPSSESNDSWDVLDAAAKFSEQLRQVGPLFLVIDDYQWADRDSRAILERLQTATSDIGLGIITVSRNRQDPHRIPATCCLHLNPLKETDAMEIIATSALRWGVHASPSLLRRLVRLAGGIPFRLQELAEEFRPGGALHDCDSNDLANLVDLSSLNRLWQRRTERLSDEAKQVLPLIVTAGGYVSIEQLAALTGLGHAVDAAVTELVRQRLVIDEATGGECITIYHDRVADELIRSFSDAAKQNAHHAWASLLVRQDRPERLAARIAGHCFAAGQPGRAIAHAILAAEDAERRVAKAEAGRWYARVTYHVSGEEKIRQLRNAARCFHQADFPMQAAKYYRQLSLLVDGEERIECMLMATSLSIRSGRLEQVRPQLHELASLLGMPKPKASWKRPFSMASFALRLNLHRLIKTRRNAGLSDELSADSRSVHPSVSTSANTNHDGDSLERRRARQAFQLCRSLVLPLSLFDYQYAVELNAAGAWLAERYGDPTQRLYTDVRRSVFGCYDRGPRRIDSEASLMMLRSQVEKLGSDPAMGDWWSGIAYSHALACRWDQVSQPVISAVEHYGRLGDAYGFEIAHTRWIDLWAKWHLGQWDAMQHLGDSMMVDAIRRDDLFQQMVAMGGFGVGAWLIRDRSNELERRRIQFAKSVVATDQPTFFRCFESIAWMQVLIYRSEHGQAWQLWQDFQFQLKTSPVKRVQMLRVAGHQLGATIGLHHVAALLTQPLPLDKSLTAAWVYRVRDSIQCLRHERIGFASLMADYFEALLERWLLQTPFARLTETEVCQRLAEVIESCRQRRLRPFALAAEDALSIVQSGRSSDHLLQRMQKSGVSQPEWLQLLYTVPEPSV